MFKLVLAALAATLSIGTANAEALDKYFDYNGKTYEAPHPIAGELRFVNNTGVILNLEGFGISTAQDCNHNVFTQDWNQEYHCTPDSFKQTYVGLTGGKQVSFYNPGDTVKASPLWSGFGSTNFTVPTTPGVVHIVEFNGVGHKSYYREYDFTIPHYIQDNPPGIDIFTRAI